MRDVVGFHARTVGDLVTAFHKAIDDYLESCAGAGKTPERPYSGKLMLRVDPQVHAASARAAELAGISFNLWNAQVLAKTAGVRAAR